MSWPKHTHLVGAPKGYIVPNRDPAKWQQASVVAKAVRRETLAAVKCGELSLSELREKVKTEKGPLLRLKVGDVLKALRGPKRGSDMCRELRLDPTKELWVLGPAQWHRLIGRFDAARRT